MATTLKTAGSLKSGIVTESPLSSDDTGRKLNSDFDWDVFDSAWYRDHNYRTLRDDDQQIIHKVRDYFANTGVSHGQGVDVGSGANLYPALSMLPFCDHIELREFASSNVEWLRAQLASFDDNWDAFWAEFGQHAAYAPVTDPRVTLGKVATIHQGSIFDLPKRAWDIGTMFFVACSLSTDKAEFRRAVHSFIQALRPGAPFAAAFMVQSQGYRVADRWFPAVAIDKEEIDASLAHVAYDVLIHDIDTGAPLREGYGGMCLATGRATG